MEVWQTSNMRRLRLGEEKKKKEKRRKKKPQGKNIMSASATQGGHNKKDQLNIGGALNESSLIPFHVPRSSLADPAAGLPCSNAANIGERKTSTQSEFCT